jgi:hypothetical protein
LGDPDRKGFKLFGGFFKDIGNHKKLDHDEFLC